ncbi:hypothetical protein CPC08DRAFT_711340 [Agrocybe pediades]|nr:hypothetical protein CPC08DRAFT_711340 [Agrocybe pediades]
MPEQGESFVRMALQRLEFMFWTTVAPEMMILWAIRQWLGADKLRKQYKSFGWTKTHGYFVQMGGFMLYKQSGEQVGVLSAARLEELLERGEAKLPNVTEKELWDRSKADGLSKTIVLGQTTWFIAQCIARKIQDFEITELELVTVAFAFLNAFMYVLWWNKPLNANTPIPVFLLDEPIVTKEEGADREDQETVGPTSTGAEEKDTHQDRAQAKKTKKLQKLLSFLKSISQTIISPFRKTIRWFAKLVEDKGVLWVLGSPVVAVGHIISRLGDMARNRSNTPIGEGKKRVPTFYAIEIEESQYNNAVALTSAIAISFGGIHCAGWTFNFPSHAEAQLWRVSSTITTAIAFAAFLFSLIKFAQAKSSMLKGKKCRTGIKVIGDLVLYSLPFYVVARLLILFAAFISLRSLSLSALSAVEWTSFLPHI